MKIKDNQFRKTKSHRHPFMEPYMAFSDKKGAPTIYFESKYDDTEFCKKHWGIAPFELYMINSDLYHWPEKPENKVIVLKQGGNQRIPHGFYIVNTTTGEPATYNVRSENNL